MANRVTSVRAGYSVRQLSGACLLGRRSIYEGSGIGGGPPHREHLGWEKSLTELAADPRFQGRFAWEITPEEYDTIRTSWLTHVGAEEKLFVPHSAVDEEAQLAIVFGTMTDECVYEIKQTGERWQGQAAARQFYQRFLAAFSGMKWVPQTVVIGPQGILDVADMTATLEAPFAGFDSVGQTVRLEWVVYFPWNPDLQRFEGETFYSIRALSP